MERIGRYEIANELGRGAMGVVYQAKDPAIGRSVAIKVIRIADITDLRQRDKLKERLFREARSAGVLSHPNIVTIYDMDEDAGNAYIAMAWVNGPSLHNILSSGRSLGGADFLRILRQSASALDYAHGRSVIHRDVKPANLMTDEDGAVKITDFGIARILDGARAMETGTVVGTPNYMSPEQVQGLEIDGRSDQFSLAVIAYEILTGETPFQSDNLSRVVYRIVSEEPAHLWTLNPTLTAAMDEVLRRALAKKPGDRFTNCSSFVGALEMACGESPGWSPAGAGAYFAFPEAVMREPALPVAGAESTITGRTGKEIPREPLMSQLLTEGPPRRSLFVPVFLGMLTVLAIAGTVAWQADLIPWLGTPGEVQVTKAEPPPERPSDEPPPAAGPVSPEPAAPRKPSPVDRLPVASGSVTSRSVESRFAAPQAVDTPVPARGLAARMRDVWVTTSPAGARAVLDDNPILSCDTPCMLHGATGLHRLNVALPGYLREYRQIRVDDSAQEVPLITLREPSGTLMVTTTPPGATIRIDGKLMDEVTPASLTLKPGVYSLTVQKDGSTQTQRIEMKESTTYLRIPLGQ